MSRPFSYNDENFTVIGNILFCHIMVTKVMDAYTNLIEIPPDIYKRIINKSNIFISSGTADKVSVTNFINVGVTTRLPNEEHYIYSGSDIHDIGNYLIGYYFLKDI